MSVMVCSRVRVGGTCVGACGVCMNVCCVHVYVRGVCVHE